MSGNTKKCDCACISFQCKAEQIIKLNMFENCTYRRLLDNKMKWHESICIDRLSHNALIFAIVLRYIVSLLYCTATLCSILTLWINQLRNATYGGNGAIFNTLKYTKIKVEKW